MLCKAIRAIRRKTRHERRKLFKTSHCLIKNSLHFPCSNTGLSWEKLFTTDSDQFPTMIPDPAHEVIDRKARRWRRQKGAAGQVGGRRCDACDTCDTLSRLRAA